MHYETRTSMKNVTREVVNLPLGKKLVGCKGVFPVTHKTGRIVDRFKT